MTSCSTRVGSTTLSWPGKHQRHSSGTSCADRCVGHPVSSRLVQLGRCCFRSPCRMSDGHWLRRTAGPTCRRYWVTRPQITSKSSSRAVPSAASSAAGAEQPTAKPAGRRTGTVHHGHGDQWRLSDGWPAVSSRYLRRVSAGTEVAAASATV